MQGGAGGVSQLGLVVGVENPPTSDDNVDLTSEASARETIFTDLLADSVAVDDEAAADEAPVDGGDVPLVCSEANANAI